MAVQTVHQKSPKKLSKLLYIEIADVLLLMHIEVPSLTKQMLHLLRAVNYYRLYCP